MLTLPQEIQELIETHGAASFPYEGCGLLLGYQENGRNVVTNIKQMTNVWPVEAEKPERFRIDEQAWVQAELEAMVHGVDIIGIFHSHPNHPPDASPRDLAWAAWPGYSYLITEIRDGAPRHSRSWQLAPDRSGFVEEAIELRE